MNRYFRSQFTFPAGRTDTTSKVILVGMVATREDCDVAAYPGSAPGLIPGDREPRPGDHRADGRADQQRDGGGVGRGPRRFRGELLEPGDPQRLTPQRVPARHPVTHTEHPHDLGT